jgi:MmyB-like transcription regulator ligand binding domain
MVVRLGEALEVPLRERNALLRAAGFAPAYPHTRLDDPSLDPVRSALEHVLDGHLPYPAVLTDRDAQLVAANPALSALLDGAAPWLLEAPVNLARVLLHPDGVAPRIGNLGEWGWHVIDGLARKADREANRALEALIAELREYVPPAAAPRSARLSGVRGPVAAAGGRGRTRAPHHARTLRDCDRRRGDRAQRWRRSCRPTRRRARSSPDEPRFGARAVRFPLVADPDKLRHVRF